MEVNARGQKIDKYVQATHARLCGYCSKYVELERFDQDVDLGERAGLASLAPLAGRADRAPLAGRAVLAGLAGPPDELLVKNAGLLFRS